MRNTLLLLFISFSITASSQIKFQTSAFSDALAKAKSENKMIFLQLEAEDCKQCTEVANKAFEEKALSSMINETFITLYISANHNDRNEIELLYNLPEAFGTLFIDHNKTLIHRFPGTYSFADKYREQILIAYNKLEENSRMADLEKDYRNGNKTLSLIQQILIYKNEQGLDKTSILDDYITLLPKDSLNSIHTIHFVASMAPIIGSKAYSTIRRNTDLFNTAWYLLPLSQRVNINNRIINLSLLKAIKNNDEAYAIRIANFAKGITTTTKEAAERNYYRRLLDFYGRTENQAKYLQNAVYYYDNFYMTVNVDSVKKIDEKRHIEMAKSAKRDTINTETGIAVRSSFTFSPIAQRYTIDLKNAAWTVYKMSSDTNYLEKATTWVKRGLEFYEKDDALHVYAHLLYKLGKKDEAIVAEKKVIVFKKEQGYPITENKEILAKMEKGIPLQ